jgi:hypothetical protein
MNEQQPTTPMRFIDIGRGEFATQMQQAFEKAASVAMKRGCSISIKNTITIVPPKARDANGEISFNISVSEPPVKSFKYMTEVSRDGAIVSDGTDAAQILQVTFDEQLRIPSRSNANG